MRFSESFPTKLTPSPKPPLRGASPPCGRAALELERGLRSGRPDKERRLRRLPFLDHSLRSWSTQLRNAVYAISEEAQ